MICGRVYWILNKILLIRTKFIYIKYVLTCE